MIACSGPGPQGIGRAGDATPPGFADDVSGDHGRLDTLVAEQFLDGANVVPGDEEVRRKAVAEGVASASAVRLQLQPTEKQRLRLSQRERPNGELRPRLVSSVGVVREPSDPS